MIILTLRTERPEAELSLYRDKELIKRHSWLANRQLAETLHQQIFDLLKANNLAWADLDGLVGYRGPGSFTGLRIGLTVANTLADGLGRPIVGAAGEDWQKTGIERLLAGQNDIQVLPEYGAEPHITTPRH